MGENKMTPKLIELADGIFVEVDASEEKVQQISSRGSVPKKVDRKLDDIKSILLKVCSPLTEVWRELNQEIHIEQSEVELGLSFEGKGRLYIASSKVGANFKVKLIMKPKE